VPSPPWGDSDDVVSPVMPRRTVSIFLLVCLFTGICIFLGSGFGNVVSERGLFVGAVIGGVLGVLGSVRMAIHGGWLEREAFGKSSVVGIIAFLLAAWIAMRNLDGPVIPVLSVGLVGVGVLIGRYWARRAMPKASD
jgi:hypothetical protein